jgi:truncated hemoglobin YjbI
VGKGVGKIRAWWAGPKPKTAHKSGKLVYEALDTSHMTPDELEAYKAKLEDSVSKSFQWFSNMNQKYHKN